ncbi:MAG: diphosphomevalonate decarboxylase [Xanthomonadales bacterium]|nr:diphosphomevalonate decarboxylase [Xanthomonadales bacterium]
MHTITAIAHPNIALIKYWGKRDTVRNLPATHSLSITLNTLETHTCVNFSAELSADQVYLNKALADDAFSARVGACLDGFRTLAGVHTFASVHTSNNFPTAAGLASSASGFAALLTAANAALESPLNLRQLAILAREASGSAGRSLFGGYVIQHRGQHSDGSDSYAEALFPAKHWPLEVVIAITSEKEKNIGSTEGMLHTAATAPYWRAWVDRSAADIQAATAAIKQRDFAALAEVAEASCLAMHALMQSARPGLLYWNAATIELIHKIRQLRATGLAVFFTIDAGPQVKAVCLPEAADKVEAALKAVPGVLRTLRCLLGAGARISNDANTE